MPVDFSPFQPEKQHRSVPHYTSSLFVRQFGSLDLHDITLAAFFTWVRIAA